MPAPGSFTLFLIVPHRRNEQVVEVEEVGGVVPIVHLFARATLCRKSIETTPCGTHGLHGVGRWR